VTGIRDRDGKLALVDNQDVERLLVDDTGRIVTPSWDSNSGSLPIPGTVALLGDSITQRHVIGDSASVSGHDTRGYWTWAAILLRQRLALVKVAGVAGDRTDQMQARYATDIAPSAPGWLVVQAGVNDVTQGVSAATIISNLTSLYTTAIAAGTRVIATTITPNTGWSAAQKLVRAQVNEWMRGYASTQRGIVLCDWSATVTDEHSGLWITGYSPDNTHPNTKGAARMGKALADTISPILASYPALGLPVSNDDPTNGAPNSFFDTLGAAWTFGGTSTNTTVARTDQIPGNWQQQVTASAVNCFTRYSQDSPANFFALGTDLVYGVCEMQSDAFTSATVLELDLIFRDVGNTQIYIASDIKNSQADPFPLENQPGLGTTHVLRTPAVVIPAATAHILLQAQFTGQGTVRWGRLAMRKLAAPLTAMV
jgi:lysophospholipase L1-like esterase